MNATDPRMRRNFLLAAGLGAVVAAAAAEAPRVHSKNALPESGAKEKSGYRATPHILTYYKTTQF
jgi:hypothetical protein